MFSHGLTYGLTTPLVAKQKKNSTKKGVLKCLGFFHATDKQNNFIRLCFSNIVQLDWKRCVCKHKNVRNCVFNVRYVIFMPDPDA